MIEQNEDYNFTNKKALKDESDIKMYYDALLFFSFIYDGYIHNSISILMHITMKKNYG